jgi:hypothetical protein
MKMTAWVVVAVALGASTASLAGTTVTVALAGRDDALPKLGRPALTVAVKGSDSALAGVVGGELARELAKVVHTRPLGADEPGDYELRVEVADPQMQVGGVSIPFAATLVSSRGERLWRVAGHADAEVGDVDPSLYASIGRNVVSALIHDGWLAARYDPEDPPPQAPHLR